MSFDPTTVVLHVYMDPDKGVLNYSLANAISDRMRAVVVSCLRNCLHDAYEQFVAIKYPPSGATAETRRRAYAFAFEVFTKFVLDNYVRVEE